MAERPRLRVNVPGTVVSRPVTPGPNSWATSAAPASDCVNQPSTKSQPTNRSKYEDKPIPPLPLNSIHPYSCTKTNESSCSYDATGTKTLQTRAFTDPSLTKLTISNDPSDGISGSFEHRRDSAPLAKQQSTSPDEVALGLERATSIDIENRFQSPTSQPKIKRKPLAQPPSSAPAFTSIPYIYSNGRQYYTKGNTSALLNQGRQANSTPVPARQPVREEAKPEPQMDFASAEAMLRSARQSYPENGNNIKDAGGIVLGNSSLHPTLNDSYGSVRGCEVIDGIQNARVNSCIALIEGSEMTTVTESSQDGCSRSPSRHHFKSPEIAISDAFSADWYTSHGCGEVWEHCSNMGHLRPPFRPVTFQEAQGSTDQARYRSEDSAAAISSFPSEPRYQSNILRNEMPAGSLTNSWASSPNNVRTTNLNTNLPMSATVPPLFARQKLGNSAPTPPHSTYQPHLGPPSAELSRLELNVHHHVDTVFGSLARLITNKQDQAVDQMIRRIESLETRVDKALKMMKDMKESLEIHDAKRTALLRDIYVSLNVRVKEAEDQLDNCALRRNPEGSRHNQGGKSQELRPRPQRSQSVLVSPTHRTPNRMHKMSRSDANGYGSLYTDIQQSYTARSEGQDKGRRASKDVLAGIDIPINSPPDIRNHPALREFQAAPEYDPTGSPTRNSEVFYQPSFFHPQAQPGWYTKAFGE